MTWYLAPAEPEDLASVVAARAEFRAHWATFRAMPFACEFDGTLQDVQALDHMDYEGLAYPPSDINGAALVWGNVLVERAGMRWARSYRGDLLLTLPGPDGRVTVWPFARVLEAHERTFPQFGRYAWMLRQAADDLLLHGDLAPDAESWCHKLVHGGQAEMERRARG